MNNLRNSPYVIIITLAAVLLVGLGIYGLLDRSTGLETQTPPMVNLSQRFVCEGGKSIDAGFGEELVVLTLSDGRQITLEQTLSASGVRYAADDESFVFWNKGNTAFVEERGNEIYRGCVIEGEMSSFPTTPAPIATSTGPGIVVTPPDGPIACTMDAKICPDGSAVGRVPPRCEFAPCPGN